MPHDVPLRRTTTCPTHCHCIAFCFAPCFAPCIAPCLAGCFTLCLVPCIAYCLSCFAPLHIKNLLFFCTTIYFSAIITIASSLSITLSLYYVFSDFMYSLTPFHGSDPAVCRMNEEESATPKGDKTLFPADA